MPSGSREMLARIKHDDKGMYVSFPHGLVSFVERDNPDWVALNQVVDRVKQYAEKSPEQGRILEAKQRREAAEAALAATVQSERFRRTRPRAPWDID